MTDAERKLLLVTAEILRLAYVYEANDSLLSQKDNDELEDLIDAVKAERNNEQPNKPTVPDPTV